MNVAVFTDNDFDKINGVTTTLTAALQHAPSDVHLRIYTAATLGVAEPHYLALESVGVPIPFYGEMRMYLPRLGAYVEHARRDRIDVVHLTTPGPLGLAAMYVARQIRRPMIGSFHTDLAAYTALLSGSPRLGRLMGQYMRWPYSRCARVLVPSTATRQLMVASKSDPERLVVWARGVDTDLFSPSRRSWRLREAWRVDDRRPAILYVGRVSREKGLAMLEPLQRALHGRRLEHRFIIVGQGPMLPELREKLPEAVFTGPLSRDAVAEAFASADLFVFPSRTDTAGNVVLEAQASGVPVIVSAAGGPSENLVAGVTGLVCATDDVHEWAEAVVSLLHDNARRRQLGLAARAYAEGRTWPRALEPLYRAYHDVSAPHSAREHVPLLPVMP